MSKGGREHRQCKRAWALTWHSHTQALMEKSFVDFTLFWRQLVRFIFYFILFLDLLEPYVISCAHNSAAPHLDNKPCFKRVM